MSDYKFDKEDLLVKTNGGLDVIRRIYPVCEKGNKFVHSNLLRHKTKHITHAAEIFIVLAVKVSPA